MKIDDSSRVDITITRGDDLCEIARGVSGWLNLVFLRFRNTPFRGSLGMLLIPLEPVEAMLPVTGEYRWLLGNPCVIAVGGSARIR